MSQAQQQKQHNTSRSTSRPSTVTRRRLSCPFFTDQVKQNQLQWMFNRRKDKLVKTSQENINIYLRIKSQKSPISQMLRKKMIRMQNSKIHRPKIQLTQRQNYEVDDQLKRRNSQIGKVLKNSEKVPPYKKFVIRKVL